MAQRASFRDLTPGDVSERGGPRLPSAGDGTAAGEPARPNCRRLRDVRKSATFEKALAAVGLASLHMTGHWHGRAGIAPSYSRPTGPRAAARASRTSLSRELPASDAAFSNSARASPERPSLARRSPRTLGRR